MITPSLPKWYQVAVQFFHPRNFFAKYQCRRPVAAAAVLGKDVCNIQM